MPPEIASNGGWLIQLGIAGGLLYLLRSGWLATRQEVDAWRGRAERAEKQVDDILPALEQLTKVVLERKGL